MARPLIEGSNKKPQRLFLDLGDVKEDAEVRLNGNKLGVFWCFPWRVDITKAVKSTGNELEVDVINLWANRVIGDPGQPKEKRLTQTHDVFRFDMPTETTSLLIRDYWGRSHCSGMRKRMRPLTKFEAKPIAGVVLLI